MSNPTENKTLRLILGDQLNIQHSWFQKTNNSVTYVLMEIRSETDYATHHIQKVIGFFAAMRHFSNELKNLGHKVIYYKLNDTNNLQSLSKNCKSIIENEGFTKFEYLEADEFRVQKKLANFCTELSIAHQKFDSEHFFTSKDELANFFEGKKTYLMESFYRYMRKKHRILMVDEEKPMGDRWNFDSENRKKIPKNHRPIAPFLFVNDVSDISKEIELAQIKTIGKVNTKAFLWPINRVQSLELVDFFMEQCLPLFGDFQDSMQSYEWSLYHSRLSFSLNIKLISPKEVIEKAIDQYEKSPDKIEFNQLEGFVRQILGWREYMRGIYWLKMPEYAQLNYFQNQRKLPDWFWTGETKMNCLKHSIKQSLEFAYAHHIQRLMVTSNFALLTGIDPNEVDAWYLGIYIDAIEWVEITNTRGMSQFADGGIVGTKPYVSSAAYIHKMSNYCESCFYDKDKKTGDKSCPFNSLYWNFYAENEQKLSKNPRIGMAYNTLRKMDESKKKDLLDQANFYLENINDL